MAPSPRTRSRCDRALCDDLVMGFENKADAQEMLLALKARLASFGLMLHEGKTRLIEFGRFAALSRQRRGERRPETFAFLGFIHYCGRTRDGRFIVKHKTEGKRLTRKLTALRQEAWRLMHESLATQHEWFAAALRGHCGYYGRPHNYPALNGLSRSASDLAAVSETAQSEKSAHGVVGVRDPDGTLPSARSTHHSHLGTGADMTRVTLGKSRMRESGLSGSVRAKPNGLATRPREESHAAIHERPAVRFRRPTRQGRLSGSVSAKPNGRATRPRSTAIRVSCATRKNALRQLLVSQTVYLDRLRILDLIGDGI
ncbi:hypothetical protein ACVWXO_000246 [Bradyrhizobium sp. LM2.7]